MPALLGQVPALADEPIYTFYLKPTVFFLLLFYRDSLKTMPTGKAEEEDEITDPPEAQDPAPRT